MSLDRDYGGRIAGLGGRKFVETSVTRSQMVNASVRVGAGSGGRFPRATSTYNTVKYVFFSVSTLILCLNPCDIHLRMAGDGVEGPSSTATASVKHNQSQKIEPYALPVVRPENANLLPGGTSNTAGGKVKEATIMDGLRSIRLSDLKEVHKKPCVREALMTGIGAGFGIGGVRAILGGMLQSLL